MTPTAAEMSGHSTTACSRRLDASHEARTACHAQFRSACDTDSMRLNSYRPETHPPKSPNPLPSPLPQLEAVLRCVQDILERGPDERIIVFSTWRDVLRLLEHAFGRNAVPHAHPQTRKALAPAFAAFQVGPGAGAGSATPRVLLLLVKQGGNGLNLTAAQHVILVEPLRSPGLEAQAVGRVDRVGQLRETHVYRFVMNDTIEQNLHRLNCARGLTSQATSSSEPKHLGLREVALLLQDPARPPSRQEKEETSPCDGP
uniref:Helicase C-terminal domain-containing protein n=3 Tax=Auxenochlorella protothecoides TaxID=3075 RepID=A0A1D2AFR3_AUXPR